MNSSRNSFEMVFCSRFIILQSVVTRYLFVQKVVNCCYQTKMNEIDLNKEAALISTRNAINSIPSVETPSYLTQGMEMFSDFMQTYNTLQGIKSMRKKAGVEADMERHLIEIQVTSHL